jgi:hypothetical protein
MAIKLAVNEWKTGGFRGNEEEVPFAPITT